MLAQTLVLVAILFAVAGVVIDGAAAWARASLVATATHALDGATRRAVVAYQTAAASAIANDPSAGTNGTTPPGPIAALVDPSRIAVPPAIDEPLGAGSVTFRLFADVTPTTVAAPSCGAPAQGGDVALALQCNPWIAESRVSLRVHVRVATANGAATLAERTQNVTLRLFAIPPYSSVAGTQDAAALVPVDGDPNRADLGSAPAHEGDATGSSATTLHVVYRCSGDPCPPPPAPDSLRDATWQNGNAGAAAW